LKTGFFSSLQAKSRPGSVGSFIYIDDVLAHKREIIGFAASLRNKGVVLRYCVWTAPLSIPRQR
jgi:hypothetical protein